MGERREDAGSCSIPRTVMTHALDFSPLPHHMTPAVTQKSLTHAVFELNAGSGYYSPVVAEGGVGLVARMVAECMPSATWWVGVMVMSVNPAAASPSW